MKIKKYTAIFLTFLLTAFIYREDSRLPGICLSFDDRSVKEWYGIKELLCRYDAKVTFFVTKFDSLSTEEIKMLKDIESDGHEIGSHGALHVRTKQYIKNNSYKSYMNDEVERSIRSMKSNGFEPRSFAYPYGANYWFTDYLLLKKFEMLRGAVPLAKEGNLTDMNKIYYDHGFDQKVYALGIDNNAGVTKNMIRKAINRAAKNKEVLMIFGHVPVENAKRPYEVDIDLLEFILAEAQGSGLKFYRVIDLKK